MGSSNQASNSRKRKHDRRRAHQREQRLKREIALAEATEHARTRSKDGTKTLSRPRTNSEFTKVLEELMLERGYKLETKWRTIKRVGKKPERIKVERWLRTSQEVS